MEMVIHEKRYTRREHTESSAKSGGHPQRGVYTEEITHTDWDIGRDFPDRERVQVGMERDGNSQS